ncbi:MAG: DNA polymerase III subunit beta, partial [Clostridia bacterium]|nr:DNA polymerase III subunit beta [Clostridia bacterium]
MKVIVNGTDLSSAVMKVSKAISVRTTNPVLEGIKISVKGDNMTLLSTDMEIAIEKTIRSDTFEEGETVVPGRIFTEFVKKLESEDQVEMVSEEDNRLKIVYEENEVYFSCFNAKEFPSIRKDLKEKAFSILQKDFKSIINKAVFCCSTNESRPILKGCLFEINENDMTVVALDGVRLALIKKALKNSTGSFTVIVPARALNEISRLLEKDEEEITFVSEDNILMIEVDGTILTTRLLEGDFINYKQVLPNEHLTTIKVKRETLLNSLERASVVVKDNDNSLITLEIKENYVNIKRAVAIIATGY